MISLVVCVCMNQALCVCTPHMCTCIAMREPVCVCTCGTYAVLCVTQSMFTWMCMWEALHVLRDETVESCGFKEILAANCSVRVKFR